MSLVALVCFGCCIFFHVNVKYKNQFLHIFKKFGRKLISDKTNKKNTASLIRKSDYSKISMLWTFSSLAFGFHKIDYQCHYYQILILCRSWNLSWKIIRQSRDEGLKFSFCFTCCEIQLRNRLPAWPSCFGLAEWFGHASIILKFFFPSVNYDNYILTCEYNFFSINSSE